jgi:hypothetical protein
MLHSVNYLLERLRWDAGGTLRVTGQRGFDLAEIRVVADRHEEISCAERRKVSFRFVEDVLEEL